MKGSLAGKRILVVEDEYFIASDLRQALQKDQAIVVGPAGDLPLGLALLDGEPIDAAVLDVNLESASSYPIADRLDELRIPYMFLTGYDDWALPESYRHVPRVAKPFTMPALLKRIVSLIEQEPGP